MKFFRQILPLCRLISSMQGSYIGDAPLLEMSPSPHPTTIIFTKRHVTFHFEAVRFSGNNSLLFFFKFLNSNKAGKQESKNSVQGKPGINGSTLLKPTKAKTHAGDIHNLYNLYQFHSQQPSMPGQWPQVWHSSSSPSLEVAQQQQSQYIPQGMLVVGGGKWMAVRYERIVPKV